MRALIRLLHRLNIPYQITPTTDGDKALSPALFRAFGEKNHRINHVLRIWHINQNVTANCKKHFATLEQWETFCKKWKTVVYSVTVAELEDNYNSLHSDYPEAHGAIFEYLEEHTKEVGQMLYRQVFTFRKHCFFSWRGSTSSGQTRDSILHR